MKMGLGGGGTRGGCPGGPMGGGGGGLCVTRPLWSGWRGGRGSGGGCDGRCPGRGFRAARTRRSQAGQCRGGQGVDGGTDAAVAVQWNVVGNACAIGAGGVRVEAHLVEHQQTGAEAEAFGQVVGDHEHCQPGFTPQLQEQLVHLEGTEKSLKAQEEILKRQLGDLVENNSHTK